MSQYRHVGTYTQVLDTNFVFSRFGQLAEVPEEIARSVRTLVSANDWDAEGVTTEELRLFGDAPGGPSTQPGYPEFARKRDALWAKAALRFEAAQEVK